MSHPLYKCGKKKPRRDSRNLQLRAILKPKLKLPTEYSFDALHPTIPLRMFGNADYGDCVEAAKANITLNFELLEQKKVLSITDKEVLNNYFRETGGGDDGLYLLDSLNDHRKTGFKTGGVPYKIKAFAEINRQSKTEVMTTIFSDSGSMIGINLPISAQAEINAGKPWSQTSGKGSVPGSWGGHCVLLIGYTKTGPICRTWAQHQAMTWGWFAKYCDEAYTVIDALDSAKSNRVFNRKSVDSFLSSL